MEIKRGEEVRSKGVARGKVSQFVFAVVKFLSILFFHRVDLLRYSKYMYRCTHRTVVTTLDPDVVILEPRPRQKKMVA